MLVARREEIEWVDSEGENEFVPMQECKHENVGLDLGGHRQVGGSSIQEDQIQTMCKRIQDEEAR